MTEPVRLAKRVAAMVPCSRREAEQYIEGGWVRVDGRGGRRAPVPRHRRAAGRTRSRRHRGRPRAGHAAAAQARGPVRRRRRTAACSCPPRPAPRTTTRACARVKRHFAQLAALMPLPPPGQRPGRVQPGPARGAQAHRRRAGHRAGTDRRRSPATIAPDGLARLCHGLAFEGRALPPIKVSWQNETRLRFALKGIPPWLVEWMCEQVGLRAGGAQAHPHRPPADGRPAARASGATCSRASGSRTDARKPGTE